MYIVNGLHKIDHSILAEDMTLK